jgi:RNase H-fold protein (predicted Holliday junction resolvase)
VEKKSKGWPKIGTLRKGDYGHYIVLEKGVEILVDGQKIAMNDKRSVRLEDPKKTVEMLLEKGVISEEKAQERLATLEANAWLKYELVVPPPKPA